MVEACLTKFINQLTKYQEMYTCGETLHNLHLEMHVPTRLTKHVTTVQRMEVLT